MSYTQSRGTSKLQHWSLQKYDLFTAHFSVHASLFSYMSFSASLLIPPSGTDGIAVNGRTALSVPRARWSAFEGTCKYSTTPSFLFCWSATTAPSCFPFWKTGTWCRSQVLWPTPTNSRKQNLWSFGLWQKSVAIPCSIRSKALTIPFARTSRAYCQTRFERLGYVFSRYYELMDISVSKHRWNSLFLRITSIRTRNLREIWILIKHSFHNTSERNQM